MILNELYSDLEYKYIKTRLIERIGKGTYVIYRILPKLKQFGLVEEVEEEYPRKFEWIRITEKGIAFMDSISKTKEILMKVKKDFGNESPDE